jgi:hypothetical protein
VFTQDLFKPSIRLDEDILVQLPGTFRDEGSLVPTLVTLPGDNSLVSVLEANLGASVGPIEQSPGSEGGVAAIIGPPSPEVDW